MAEPSPRQRRVRTPKTVHCAAVLREADGLLCLEDAENLLWSGGDLNAVDRMDLEQATRRKPRPEPGKGEGDGVSRSGRRITYSGYNLGGV